MNKYFLLLDLVDEPTSIGRYEAYHKALPLEIELSIKNAGILSMDIYRFGNRLLMEMITNDQFSFDQKKISDLNNPAVVVWEKLMDTFQQQIPGSKADEKWVVTKQIFSLT